MHGCIECDESKELQIWYEKKRFDIKKAICYKNQSSQIEFTAENVTFWT